MLEGLIHALYELPMKATSFLTIDKLMPKGYESCHQAYVDSAKSSIDGYARSLNNVQGWEDKAIQGYATKGGYDSVESYLNLKHYVLNCGGDLSTGLSWDSSFSITQLNENAQKLVNYAIEYAQENGKEIPFTNNPILDAMILGSIVVGIPLAFRKFAGRYSGKLFHDYSKT